MRPAAELGELIYEIREEAYLTQSQLAAELGVSQPAVSNWERGLMLPRQWTMKQMALLAPGMAQEMAEIWQRGRRQIYQKGPRSDEE